MSAGCKKISIVVPVHNGAEHTRRFLDSLSRATYPCFELIVVDDGSTDNTAELLGKPYPFEIRVISGDGNLWWTKAVNLGVRAAMRAGSSYVLTINNDTTVEPGFMERLMACSEDEGGAIVGPRICHMDDNSKVWSETGRICWYSGKLFYTRLGSRKAGEQAPGRHEVEFVHGMGALVPVEVYEKIGLYDQDNYPQYHADAEFSLRAGVAGIRLMVEPAALIYNDVSHSRAADIRKKLDLITPLFSPYSPYSFKVNWKLYRDYAPNLLARYLGFIVKYVRYFLGTFRYLV